MAEHEHLGKIQRTAPDLSLNSTDENRFPEGKFNFAYCNWARSVYCLTR
jgi:hypothetical protein